MIKATTQTPSQIAAHKLATSRRLGVRIDDLVRRTFDLCASLAGLILLSPFFFLLGVLLKCDSPGPVFYRGLRAGKGGRNFQILKFRTMYEAPKSYQGPRITAADDPRITPLGRWLRDTKLNELPQLWNVLKGEMSLVGPRPEDPEIVAQWPEPVREELLSVRPGVTSPASILYRDEEKLLQVENVMHVYLREIVPSKWRLDLRYVRTRSLLVDLDVLFWTLVVLLPGARRKAVPEHLLFCGPVSVFCSRYLNWFLVDTLVAMGATVTAGLLWQSGDRPSVDMGVAASIAVGMALLFDLMNCLLGLDRIAWARARAVEALALIFPSGLATFILLALDSFWPTGPLLPQGMMLVSGLLAFLGFVTVRYRTQIIMGLATHWSRARGAVRATGERVLIIGAGEGGKFATRLLRNGAGAQAFSIVGMVDDDPRLQGMRIDGCTVVGRTEDIPSLTEQYDIGFVLFAISNIQLEDRQRILSLCKATPVHLVFLSDLMEGLRAQLPLRRQQALTLVSRTRS